MADSLDFIATELEQLTESGTEFNAAVQKVLEGIITDHGAVVFNGDGYSDEWQVEAAARGLKNLRTTVDALPELDTPEAKALFAKYDVLNERELKSRYEVYLEQYELSVVVEAKSTLEMAKTMLLPAAMRYQSELASTAANLKAIGYDADTTVLDLVTSSIADLLAGIATLESGLAHEGHDTTLEGAAHVAATLLPAMLSVRAAADALEDVVADDLWPLPTYQEMLFIL
jgi:glutamine synthetase